MYRFKQAPRSWDNKIYGFIRENEFVKWKIEHCVYSRRSRSGLLILCLHVDDLLITDSCKKEIEDFKCDMSKEFEIYDLGNISYFLGI